MTPARQLLLQFVLEKLEGEPLARRVKLYRALAADVPETAPEFKLLTSLADALEELLERHDQLLLNITAQQGGSQS
jgi:hypothetical protein